MDYKKEAVNIGVTLSTQLITAALAMITIVGTFAVFIMDKRTVNFIYYTIIVVSFLSFIISIYFGGKGIDKARKNAFNDTWNLVDTKSFFNNQALSCFLGIFFFIISIFLGTEKKDDSQKLIESVEKKIIKLEIQDSINEIKIRAQVNNLNVLNKKVDSFENILQKRKFLKKTLPKKCCKTIIQNFDSISILNNNIK